MGKIAVPLFDRRVSPRFDCAGDFLIAAVENGEIIKRRKLSAAGWNRKERVKNLRHLAVTLRDLEDDLVVIRLGGSYETLVFRRDDLIDSTEEILEDEGIRSQFSDDLKEIWGDQN